MATHSAAAWSVPESLSWSILLVSTIGSAGAAVNDGRTGEVSQNTGARKGGDRGAGPVYPRGILAAFAMMTQVRVKSA